MGFYSQNGLLILTASNLTDQGLTGTMTLRGLADGRYRATDLFMGATIDFTVANGKAVMAFPITRWDTRAFAVKKA